MCPSISKFHPPEFATPPEVINISANNLISCKLGIALNKITIVIIRDLTLQEKLHPHYCRIE